MTLRRHPERTAWIVLSLSFAVFCLLVYLVPASLQWYVENAAANHSLTLAGSSTVYVQRPGRASLEANLTEIPVGSLIATETNAQATLTFLSSDKRETLASLSIYGDTQVSIARAESPRFSAWSTQPHRITLILTKGRLRVLSAGEGARAVEITVTSAPDATTRITAAGANASVESTFVGTTVTVREGQATVTARGQSLTLEKDQRAEVAQGAAPAGPLPVERNLIRDGEFQEPPGVTWRVDARPPADPNESPGEVQPVTIGGRRAMKFQRRGENWGQVGLEQDLNQDVRDFKSLRLLVDVFLSFQDLSNCGSQGTECPVMVKLRYLDTAGFEKEWLQGFYYKYDANPVFGYTFCAPCSPRYADHLRVEQNQWRTFESDNLLEAMRVAGSPAALLKSVSLYASGHTFDSSVAQVQLLASD